MSFSKKFLAKSEQVQRKSFYPKVESSSSSDEDNTEVNQELTYYLIHIKETREFCVVSSDEILLDADTENLGYVKHRGKTYTAIVLKEGMLIFFIY